MSDNRESRHATESVPNSPLDRPGPFGAGEESNPPSVRSGYRSASPVAVSPWRVVAALISVFAAFVLTRAAVLPYRATADEKLARWDVADVVVHGRLLEPTHYAAGSASQLIAGTILEVTGLEYRAFDLLSPFIGTIAFGSILVFCAAIYVRYAESPSPWGIAAVGGSILVFAGFVNRLTETTHKPFTFVLVFGLLFVLVRVVDAPRRPSVGSDHRRRLRWLFAAFGAGIMLYNYVWGAVYVGAGILTLAITSRPVWREVGLVALPAALGFVLTTYLPVSQLNERWIRSMALAIVGFLTGVDTGGAPEPEGTGGVFAWGYLDLGALSIPIWFVYASGIITVAFLAAFSVGRVVVSVVRSPSWSLPTDRDPVAACLLPLSAWIGTFVVVMGATGGIQTLKRLVVVPGVFGVLSLAVVLSRRDDSDSVSRASPVRRYVPSVPRRRVLVVIGVILLCASVLAVPRMVLDGGHAPYDTYGEASQVEQWDWYAVHRTEESNSECAVSQSGTTGAVGNKLLRGELPTNDPVVGSQSMIYDSGPNARFFC